MRKNILLVGVIAGSLALSFNANADTSSDLMRGRTPTQAAAFAWTAGNTPAQIKLDLMRAGLSRPVASTAVALAPTPSVMARSNSGLDSRGAETSFFGYSLANSIQRYLDRYTPPYGRGLMVIIAIFRPGSGPYPPGPSPS